MEEKRFETRNLDEKKLPLPQIHIENKGCVTKVYVDGVELKSVRRLSFLHDKEKDTFPVLRIELLVEQISIDTAQIFALPEAYHPFYVSADKLIKLGVLTNEQLNTLLESKLL